jgi:hypothetical protein
MIPRTFPSTYASNGQQQMVVYFLTSIAGLQRWADYIPVKLSQGGVENSYANNGYIDVTVISSPTATQQAWKEYIPVYLDDSATDAWLVNAVGYIPYGYALFGDASLMLDMTNGGALDPRITFSRTTNATLTDSTGAIAYAPHNLLTSSESFDSGLWSKTNATVTANTTAAPDGTTTADRLNDDATNGGHRVLVSVTTTAQSHVLSVFAKYDNVQYLYLRIDDSGPTQRFAWFDIQNGTVGTVQTNLTASIVDAGGGWYRCIVVVSAARSGSNTPAIGIATADNTVDYAGGAGRAFLWGAQLNVGTLQPYNPTTVKNLLGFTQEFDNAAWGKSNASITANATASPDGFVTADKLVENTSAGFHSLSFINASVISGTTYTYSVYAKAGERSLFQINSSTGFSTSAVRYNLLTGATTIVSGSPTVSLVNVGNGWYRCSLTIAATSTTASGAFTHFLTNGTTSSYTGDGTSGVFIWGAQLSDSASLDPYVYNPAAAPASTAYYGPRFDYDPVTLAARGLLIEEQRTNSIRNNTMVGAVAGTPGTLPTNWSSQNIGGVALTEVVGVGVEDGIAYVDIRYAGTTSSTAFGGILSEGSNVIAAANGQNWSSSLFIKLVGGSLAGINSVNNNIIERDAGGLLLAQTTTAVTPTSAALSSQRNSTTRTLNNASTAFVQQRIAIGPQSGAAIDITLRIGLPQLELGAFSTSVIPTSTAAATRAADVASMLGDNFANWYSVTEGSLYAEYLIPDIKQNQGAIAISDGTLNNRMIIRGGNSSTQTTFIGVTAGVAEWVQSIAGAPVNSTTKSAFAYETNNIAWVRNAGTVGTDTSAAIPVVNQLRIGSDGDGTLILNGYIRRISYFPRRVSNAELQALTV